LNKKKQLLEFQLWQRIRNFFDRNLNFLKSKQLESKLEAPSRRTQRKVGGSGEVRLVSPPFGKSVKGKPGTNVIYAKLKTPAQASRANRINSKLYK